MVLGWLCGGHAGLRPRLEHQEHGFDKSNFCLESLPNMTGLPNHRCILRIMAMKINKLNFLKLWSSVRTWVYFPNFRSSLVVMMH